MGSTEIPSITMAFTAAVIAAGGTPILVPTTIDVSSTLDEAVAAVDALLLSGGGDVHPSEYGQQVNSSLDAVDRQRDRVEMSALRAARRAEKRVLGICRGAQLMAVATGGTLIQDLPARGHHGHIDENHDRGYASLKHPIKAEPGSCVENVLAGLDEVNSHHHQAIEDVGGLLIATAWAPDGVIEAVEAPGKLGVQWHPEALVTTDERHLGPFRWLIEGN